MRVVVAALALALSVAGCALEKDLQRVDTKHAEVTKSLRDDVAALKTELEATRSRLENALRANADASTDSMGDRAKLQALGGRMDEAGHAVEELKKELASTRREFDARLDDLKRAQDVQGAPKAPPVTVPSDKAQHYAALDQAYRASDWNVTRALGREYVSRYPEDERSDDALYLMGDASLKEGRPASALGEFNRVLKQFPRSNVLGQTLFGMGESYLLLHDCTNAKLAFGACESRFAKEKIGVEARARIARIQAPTPGLCAPP